MESVTIEAPDDVLIVQIAAQGNVTKGQQLVALTSPRLKLERSRLIALEEHLSFLERPFNDGRIDEEIAKLADKAKLLAQAADAQIMRRDEIKAIVDSGSMGSLPTLEEENVKMFQALNSKIDADLASSHAERKKTDLLDKITSAKNKLARDRTYLDEMEKTLTVSAREAYSTPMPLLAHLCAKDTFSGDWTYERLFWQRHLVFSASWGPLLSAARRRRAIREAA
jgi:hypothetical protein